VPGDSFGGVGRGARAGGRFARGGAPGARMGPRSGGYCCRSGPRDGSSSLFWGRVCLAAVARLVASWELRLVAPVVMLQGCCSCARSLRIAGCCDAGLARCTSGPASIGVALNARQCHLLHHWYLCMAAVVRFRARCYSQHVVSVVLRQSFLSCASSSHIAGCRDAELVRCTRGPATTGVVRDVRQAFTPPLVF